MEEALNKLALQIYIENISYLNNREHLSNIYRECLFHKSYLNENQNTTHALTKTDTIKQD